MKVTKEIWDSKSFFQSIHQLSFTKLFELGNEILKSLIHIKAIHSYRGKAKFTEIG
jgi:hypothetical protein